MSNKKAKETDEEKCLRVFLGDGKPFQEYRDNALNCLKEIGGEKTFNALREALCKKLFLSYHTRNDVITLLVLLGGEQIVGMLLDLLKEEEHSIVREGIIESICEIQVDIIDLGKEIPTIQQQKVVSHLCKLLVGKNKDASWYVRRAVAGTLEFFKCEESIVALKTALSDEEEEVREVVKKSLFYLEYGLDYDLHHKVKLKRKERIPWKGRMGKKI